MKHLKPPLLSVLWVGVVVGVCACVPTANPHVRRLSALADSGSLPAVSPSITSSTGNTPVCDTDSVFANCTRLEMSGTSIIARTVHDECGRPFLEEKLNPADGSLLGTTTWAYYPDGRLDTKEVDGGSAMAPADGIPDQVWTWAYGGDRRLASLEEVITDWGTCFRDYIHDDDDLWWDQVVVVCPFNHYTEILQHDDEAPEALQWAIQDYDDGSDGTVERQRRASWDPVSESGVLEDRWLEMGYTTPTPIRTTYQYDGLLPQFTEEDYGLDGVADGRTDFSYDSDGRPTGSVYQSLVGIGMLVEVYQWECPG